MNKHMRLWRLRFGSLALVASLCLAGCGVPPALPPQSHAPVGAATPSGPSLAQTNPTYHKASECYARRDYRGALTLVRVVSAQPQISRDAAACAFLEQQARICRHALDPKVSLNPPPTAPARMAATARLADCGPRALLLLCQRAGVRTNLTDLRRESGTTNQGTTMAGLARAAQAHGFRAQGVQVNPQALSELSRPALAWVEADHYVAVLSVNGDQATIHDPDQPKEETIPTPLLWSRCGGVLLTLSRA